VIGCREPRGQLEPTGPGVHLRRRLRLVAPRLSRGPMLNHVSMAIDAAVDGHRACTTMLAATDLIAGGLLRHLPRSCASRGPIGSSVRRPRPHSSGVCRDGRVRAACTCRKDDPTRRTYGPSSCSIDNVVVFLVAVVESTTVQKAKEWALHSCGLREFILPVSSDQADLIHIACIKHPATRRAA
jgi:hypothetical protein